MNQGVWVLVVAVALATVIGLYRAALDGRFRGTHAVRGVEDSTVAGGPRPEESPTAPAPDRVPTNVLSGAGVPHELGTRGTLLQFSSAFCAPCRATRRVLADVAELVPGVTHVEVDAEQHLDLVRRLNVHRTPTTLILDPAGRELSRAAGAPSRDAVLGVLARALDDPEPS